jgi:nuclear GTP-binding protein
MRSSIKNPFGRGSLIDLLRQFSILHKDRKQISVGLIGYPNVGKSSIINALRGKAVAKVAPIPGETKVWQYVTLMKRIYLIDCPGIVPPNQHDTPQDLLLRGVVRVENVEHPEQYIPAVLKKVKTHHMERTYELKGWKDHIEFLELIARKSGRLLKGGEPDVDGVAKMVLNDFMRGKIPWFTPAPAMEGGDDTVIEGRQGRLGEMPLKRKRDEAESVADTSLAGSTVAAEGEDDEESEDEDADFSGFSSDSDSEQEDGPETEVQEGAENMIPLGDTSDEEDEEGEEGSGDEDGSEEEGAEEGAESDVDVEGASDILPSDDEAERPAQKKRKKAR